MSALRRACAALRLRLLSNPRPLKATTHLEDSHHETNYLHDSTAPTRDAQKERNDCSRLAISILLLSALPVAWGHGSGHTNLKVLSKVSHDALEDGMTDFAKGLGVKCLACHVKNEYASDERPAKVAARKFLATVLLHGSEPGQRADALKTLLNQMTLPTAKDEARIWKALARRQPSK